MVITADTAGQVTFTSYYTDTTATVTTPGHVTGSFWKSEISHGELGEQDNPRILQNSTLYYSHRIGIQTVYPIAASTVYAQEGGAEPRTTCYSYTWYDHSLQAKSQTVINPIVATNHNGSGQATSSTTIFDQQGRTIWTKDAEGFLNYTAYDLATGAVAKTITDVNTNRSCDYLALPSGWSWLWISG